jgi:hypothetical protein
VSKGSGLPAQTGRGREHREEEPHDDQACNQAADDHTDPLSIADLLSTTAAVSIANDAPNAGRFLI